MAAKPRGITRLRREGVLVFHAFVKETQRTPPLEIELARKRLKELFDASKIKPVIAGTPEDLAVVLGLPRVAAEEWQFQHVLLARLKEVARRRKIHAHGESQSLPGLREPE